VMGLAGEEVITVLWSRVVPQMHFV
jgi:hypothetical protein